MMPPAPQPQPLPQPSAPTATLSIHVTGSHALRTTCVIFEAEGMRGALSACVEIMLDEQSQKQPTLSPAPALPAPAEAPAAPPAISPSAWSTERAAPTASPAAAPRPRMSARLRETRFARALRLAALPVAALIATASTQPEHAAKAFEAAALAVDISAIAFAH